MKITILTLAFLLITTTAFANPDKVICGDVNADEEVTATDALAVLRKSIGLDDDLFCWCDGNLVIDGPEDE